MTHETQILIIGGGLAGLTAAIHLAREGLQVTLIEKKEFPHHKVCGEYISNEIKPYLAELGVELDYTKLPDIKRLEITNQKGGKLSGDLPLGGFGISRYQLDHLLVQRALSVGVQVFQKNVTDITFQNDSFLLETSDGSHFQAPVAIGAFGKRSNLDKQLNRSFIAQKSPWVGVKAHYKTAFPDDLIALHNFPGGYCGISKVENGAVNACYLAHYKQFKQVGDLQNFQEQVLYRNPQLRAFYQKSEIMFERPLSIAQISFSSKKVIQDHLLMCGDTAGLIHPLCGNGMAMAIHSAKIAAEGILDYFSGALNREALEENYQRRWKRQFSKRLRAGRMIQNIFLSPGLSSIMLSSLKFFPGIMPAIIQQTHGNPLKVNSAS